MSPAMASAPAVSTAVPPGGCEMRISAHRAFHCSRSSARSIECGLVPAIRSGGSVDASFSGVWPPSDTMTPTGCSASMTLATSSAVNGSKYRRSLVS